MSEHRETPATMPQCRSINRLFTRALIALLALFFSLLCVIGLYFNSIMRRQVYSSVGETLSLFTQQIQQDFTEALTFLSENCVQNADFSSLNISDSLDETYLLTARIQKTLSAGNYCFSNIGGLFVYSPQHDIFIRQTNATYHKNQSNFNCADRIKNLLRECTVQEKLDLVDLRQWMLLPVEGENFILRVIQKRNLYIGVWVSLEQLASGFAHFGENDFLLLFVDSEGNSLTQAAFDTTQLNLNGTIDCPAYYRAGTFERYLIVSDALPNSSFSIAALIPSNYIVRQLAALYGFACVIFVWLVLLCAMILSMARRFFNKPQEILQPVISSMRQGEFKFAIPTDGQYREIRMVTDVFNEMIREIQNLRIRIYEDALTNKEMELQYLRTQIAPHFLINCLNTIFVMSQEQEDPETLHQTIETLSEHLRYSLATKTTVSLDEELSYVRNYLSLTQLRYPGILSYEIEADEQARSARIFPHMLLMLTENSIKANLVMGENFRVFIRCKVYERSGEMRVHLTHIDSGSGFKPQSLETYNHIMEHPEVARNGYGIGIYNIVSRMNLTMGPSADICFSNEPDMGARIDMDFPFQPYEEELG